MDELIEILKRLNSDIEDIRVYTDSSMRAFKEICRDINASIPKANNEYVRTGYEISLDIIRSALERNGFNADDFMEGDVADD